MLLRSSATRLARQLRLQPGLSAAKANVSSTTPTFSDSEAAGAGTEGGPSNGLLMASAEGLRVVDLHRPKALNALDSEMVTALLPLVRDWSQQGSDVHAVVIRGTGPKAFCAGGDIRFLRDCAMGTGGLSIPMAEKFFYDEYSLNHALGTTHLPIVALVDGIVMGGGVGISVHGRVRVATENTLFAMPETGIGFFPDVGGSYFLPRLPGPGVGAYLGLTGARLMGRDVVAAGVATHFVPSTRLPQLEAMVGDLAARQLYQAGATDGGSGSGDSMAALDTALQSFESLDQGQAQEAPPSVLDLHAADIERCFDLDLSIGDITARVNELAAQQQLTGADERKSPDMWAVRAASALAGASPTSLCVTLEALRRGAALPDLGACLEMEYRIARRFLRCPDFVNGVGAVLSRSRDGLEWGTPPGEGSDELEEYFSNVYGQGLRL